MAGTRFFIPVMEKAKIESGTLFVNPATGSATSYGYEVLDYNPNSYATCANSSTALRIVMEADLSGQLIDPLTFAGIYLRNPQVFAGSTGSMTVKAGPSFSSLVTLGSMSLGGNGANQPLFLFDVLGNYGMVFDRYWELTISTGNAPDNAKIAMAMIGIYLTLDKGWLYGDVYTDGFDVVERDLGNGRVLSRLGSTQSRKIFARRYTAIDSAGILNLRNVFSMSFGPHVPIVMVDSLDSSTYDPKFGRLVRFAQGQLGEKRAHTPDTRWDVDVVFREVMQLPFGRAY